MNIGCTHSMHQRARSRHTVAATGAGDTDRPAARSPGRRLSAGFRTAMAKRTVGDVSHALAPASRPPVRGSRPGAAARPRPGAVIGALAAESVDIPMDALLSAGHENHPVIAVCGEIDMANAGDFLVRLVALVGAATDKIALDLSQVAFMDCAGLRILAEIDRYVSARGGSIRVNALSPAVARLVELIGLLEPLPGILPLPPPGAPDGSAEPLPAHRGSLQPAVGAEGP